MVDDDRIKTCPGEKIEKQKVRFVFVLLECIDLPKQTLDALMTWPLQRTAGKLSRG